jgi:hypothetical protein
MSETSRKLKALIWFPYRGVIKNMKEVYFEETA